MVTGLVVAFSLVAAAAGGDAPAARLKAIESAQAAASRRYHEELTRAGQTVPEQQQAVDRFLAEVARNTTAALALAREQPGDPAAFEALAFVVKTNRAGPGDASAQALRLLLARDDARRPRQGPLLAQIGLVLTQYPDAEAYLRRVLAENTARDARAAACYWLSQHLEQQAKLVRKLRAKPETMKDYEVYTAALPVAEFVKKDPDALDRGAAALLERAGPEFGDVTLEGDTRPLRELVAGELFALTNLAVGRTAPEIRGADHEGKPFSLVDYRGKVVVLTFSGNWCGPCVALYPQERALAEKHRGRPFAVLSVNTDEEVRTLREAIGKGAITWRCWWDGGREGPITTRWGVTSFPSTFVLDRAGVIRFKNLRGKDLDRAVDTLLNEAR